jgi:hypothetical protein
MPNWEYKIITSGTLGFASLQLLEQHLNQLGKEEWEIIHFQTRPDNPLAFHGLARRPVMRDWTVETAPPAGMPGLKSGAIPAPPEEKTVVGPDHDELRAEAEERRESLLAREESLRPLRAEADDDEGDAAEDDDEAADNEDLPTFFEAIRPHMRKNQRGPGMAVGVDFLAKKFEQTGTDLLAALQECGFSIPNGPKDPPAYLEYEGDLYWLNLNHRGQLWINTREKPRPAFKPVPGRKMATAEISETGLAAGAVTKAEDRGPERESRQKEREGPSSEPSGIRSPQSEIAAAAPLPGGAALLGQLRPRMRRNRRGGGLSGSISYLGRALKTDPKMLEAAFGAMGLVRPVEPGDKPVFVEIDAFVYWLNQDKNGQTWINARERDRRPETGDRQPESPPAELVLAADSKPEAQNPESPGGASPLAAVRLLLKETRRGGLAAEVGRLAKELGKAAGELLAALTNAGLQVPGKAREKPVFVEHAGEIFWLNRNAKGELWLNAKASKFADEMEAGKAPEGFSVEEEAAAKKSRPPRKRKDAAGG